MKGKVDTVLCYQTFRPNH